MTIRLNLGSGDDRREGYVNVDLRPEVADVVCDVKKLEHWGDATVDAIVAEDLLEHFPTTETNAILEEWARALRPGGTLTVKVPNMLALAEAITAYTRAGKDEAVRCLIRNVMGGHRWGPDGAWDTHHTNFTPALIQVALEAAGYEVLSNDMALNMRLTARRV
jgi:ubiquinone/menaquinone biosynthesis C-methylase UbiE